MSGFQLANSLADEWILSGDFFKLLLVFISLGTDNSDVDLMDSDD